MNKPTTAALTTLVGLATTPALAQTSPVVTVDRLVEHTSTVPAIAGQKLVGRNKRSALRRSA